MNRVISCDVNERERLLLQTVLLKLLKLRLTRSQWLLQSVFERSNSNILQRIPERSIRVIIIDANPRSDPRVPESTGNRGLKMGNPESEINPKECKGFVCSCLVFASSKTYDTTVTSTLNQV